MSSISGDQTFKFRHYVPPQSAQSERLPFGGPSSDAGPEPSSEPPRQSIFGGPGSQDVKHSKSDSVAGGEDGDEEPDEFDMMMRERPLKADYLSSSESFQDSDEDDEPMPDIGYRDRSESQPSRMKKYVIDPGLDLQEGAVRPNRFTGAPKTYRRLTANDRGAVEGIMSNRARDLAAHLFNAYALRKRVYETAHEKTDIYEQEMLAPFRKWWTAWPASADQVPRVDEVVRKKLDEPGTLRMPPDPRPSADLEESVTAFMMKIAKENFEGREWDFTQVNSHGRKTDESGASMNSEGGDDIDPETVDKKPLRPVVQADHDKSRQQLRPLSRNIISQLDWVLDGLHHSMKGRFLDDDSSSEWESDADTQASHSPTVERHSRRKSGSRSQSRGRKRIRRHSRAPSRPSRSVHTASGVDTQDESMRDASMSRGRSRISSRSQSSRRSTHIKLRLRDWSEVMGVASMVGLPSAAVMRASKRCADLFGQDMAFRTFHEGCMQQVPLPEDGPSWAVSEYEYTERESEGETATTSKTRPKSNRSRSRALSDRAPEPGVGKGSHRKHDIVCPIQTCPRHVDGFSRTWNLNLHLKRVHPNYRLRGARRERSTSVPKVEVILD